MSPHWTCRWPRVIAAVFLLLALAVPLVAAAESPAAGRQKIDPAVQAELTAQKESAVWVIMRDKANLAPAYGMKNWEARGRFVAAQLQAVANRSQARVRALLEGRGKGHQPFWVVNAIQVTADAATIDELARLPEVETIIPDIVYRLPDPIPGAPQPRVDAVEWNIDRIRAPEAWATFGVRGEGVVVANIDSGVQYDHPALVGQYRGNRGGGAFDHNYNWFDPTGLCGTPMTAPCDTVGHGTHTMGTMVGDDGGENQIGVAPGARWIAAKGCEYDWCSGEALLASGQWVLAPTDLSGANPRPDLRPNIVNNSWGGGGGDPFFQATVDAWNASGIFPQFSIGNAGSGCGSAGSPGDFVNSYAAGAFDYDNAIAWFSSRGPSAFGGETKPNIAAPGVDVRSSVPGNDYGSNSGTSMASPHVAGTVALIWSAAPGLIGDIAATRALLDDSAVDVADSSCDSAYPGVSAGEDNNVWGEGRLDAFAAVELAPRGPTGALEGAATDSATGAPLAGARIAVTGPYDRTTTTGPDGRYALILPAGDYEVGASAFGYIGQAATDVTVAEGATTIQDFALEAAPAYPVAGTVRGDDGRPVANVSVTILGTPIPPATTDAAGAYSFASVPAGSYEAQVIANGCYEGLALSLTVADGPVTLDFTLRQRRDAFGYYCTIETPAYIQVNDGLPLGGDDAAVAVELPFPFTFYGQTYETAYVSTNGFVNFLVPDANFGNGPIPDMNTPNAAIYAFWDDLYVTDSPGVYTGLVEDAAGRGFVIEWRDVHFCCASEEFLDVEMVLYQDGSILTQYRMEEGANSRQRGDSATIGIENETGTVGLQFSFDQVALGVPEFAVRYGLPPSGFIAGRVTDANDGLQIAGATVRALQGGEVVRTARTNDAGYYRMMVPVGDYLVEAAMELYEPATAPAAVADGATVALDFALRTARAAVSPGALAFLVPLGRADTATLTLENSGLAPMVWELRESGGGRVSGAAASAAAVKNPDYDPNALSTEGMYLDAAPRAVTPSAPGRVLRSWSTASLGWAWGVGYTGQVWLSDAPNRSNQEFTPDGERTERGWPAPWTGEWPADMAYDSTRGLICQVAVGGDNGVYCWDPASGEVAATIAGPYPWTGISQRGLAYRPDDDSFYIGGWNEGVIYHIAGLSHASPGAVLGQCSPPDGSISGLAWNAAFGVLWEATNSPDDTIYQLDPEGCGVLGTLPHPNPYFNGGGLEMDVEGNLWMISQNAHTAYLIESGVPAFNDVPWLAASPASGTLPPGGSTTVEVTVDTAALESGIYQATLFLRSNSASAPTLRVPVSLVVPAYYQTVNAGGDAYTDGAGEVWAADQRFSAGGWGYTSASARAVTTKKAIAGTDDDRLYQSLRDDPSEYRFDGLEAGFYEVELRFADLTTRRAGQRIFHVFIEGEWRLPYHDIVGEVGPLTADRHTFLVEVADGQLNIRLAPLGKGYQSPLVNAIRVIHRPDL